METIRRVFVEKKDGFDIEARGMLGDLRDNLGIHGLKKVRFINRYDIRGISDQVYNRSKGTIFSEPPVDYLYEETLPVLEGSRIFAVEYLPGQYDQRADWAAQSVQILTQQERPEILTARVFVLEGDITDAEFDKIKNYYINPVEAREAALAKPDNLAVNLPLPPNVAVLEGFTAKSREELQKLMEDLGLAMNFEDLVFCQEYFRSEEKRNPTLTEIRAIDTYWSDHCRHTTFFTEIEEVEIDGTGFGAPIEAAYKRYCSSRERVYADKSPKPVSLMDLATVAMKEMRKNGMLADLDESEEINACSIVVNAQIDGKAEEWLVMFKNETHNHPTEIEPFGGAATCLGGAIRDPLSGRSYVYQAMRVTGSGDPRSGIQDTLPGKLPQRKITTLAAHGYSSYGNQIGLATGQVAECYHPDFVAKRMEVGAVIAAAPKASVVRMQPEPGNLVILVGGRTGRDGIGGATGSSKEHNEDSLTECGAEVQKGNPPTERKIQRLFRNPKASVLIKRCNDFGAGGVSVAIGELTDGVEIELDKVPKKYEGLDGTELAISESQERMAVVVAADQAETFMQLAASENLESTIVAKVTAEPRLKMIWRGKTIVNISREFLNTSGCKQYTKIKVVPPEKSDNYFRHIPQAVETVLPDIKNAWLKNLQDLNVCSQKGLVERFDSTIGAGTVLMPFGGSFQQTPAEGMAAKLPLLAGDTRTGTIMTYGYSPYLASWSPFHGALYAVVEAAAKVAAMGGDYTGIRLSLQEYFEKLGKDSVKWGKPFSALLGAYLAQMELGIPAIGGKDSMSGTFKEMNVPPTLIAFAVTPADVSRVISPEFKQSGNQVVMIPVLRDEQEIPDFAAMRQVFSCISRLIRDGVISAAGVVRAGGLAATVSKMCFGNGIGLAFDETLSAEELFLPEHGAIVVEMADRKKAGDFFNGVSFKVLGTTLAQPVVKINGLEIGLDCMLTAWQAPLEKIFPTRADAAGASASVPLFTAGRKTKAVASVAKPRVFIPVFPGTNCEYDSARAFERAGGNANIRVVRNLTANDIEATVDMIAKEIGSSQIIMLPGGFSAGDEPDGSGKFIATMLRNPKIKEAVNEFLNCRDGLILGICNGFQVLIKLGLLPYGEIKDMTEVSPTLTYNVIGRHVSTLAKTKIVSNQSPWFSGVNVGDIHTIALSHGEGRFVASQEQIADLAKNGQIAAQYVDMAGNPTYDITYNPNGSAAAIEAITSPDGRILGKMGHSERRGPNVHSNVPGEKDQKIFESGVRYFS